MYFKCSYRIYIYLFIYCDHRWFENLGHDHGPELQNLAQLRFCLVTRVVALVLFRIHDAFIWKHPGTTAGYGFKIGYMGIGYIPKSIQIPCLSKTQSKFGIRKNTSLDMSGCNRIPQYFATHISFQGWSAMEVPKVNHFFKSPWFHHSKSHEISHVFFWLNHYIHILNHHWISIFVG